MSNRKLLEFSFGPAIVIVNQIHSTNKDNFKLIISKDTIIIFDEILNDNNCKSNNIIDNHHKFSIEHSNMKVFVSFFKDNKKHAEIGIRFDIKRLSFVQDIIDSFCPNICDDVIYFAYTGNDQFYQIPEDVKSIQVECWGAGGAIQGNNAEGTTPMYSSGSAGGGGYIKANIPVTNLIKNQNIKIIVGEGGKFQSAGVSVPATYGGGGSQYGSDVNWGTASGGGRSAIQLIENGVYNDIITAGGGGAAGVVEDLNAVNGSSNYPGYASGGAGGGLNAGDAENNIYNSIYGGTGGSQTIAGSNGIIENPNAITTYQYNASKYTGGGGSQYGAGGGGGYYGGGYGGVTNNNTNSSNSSTKDIPFDKLVLWLDASDSSSIISSNGNVTNWIDKSKSKANAIPFVGNCKYSSNSFNGLPSILFQETSMYSPLSTNTFNNGVTFFVVFSSVGDQAYNTLISRSDISNESYPGPWDICNNLCYIGNSSTNSITKITNTSFSLASDIEPSISIFQASNSTPLNFWLNNNYFTSSNSETYYQDTGNYIYLGSRADEATSMNGMISEVMVFNSILTFEQIEKIQLKLSEKWGIPFNSSTGVSTGGSYNPGGNNWIMGGGGGGSSFFNNKFSSLVEMKQANGSNVAGNSNLPPDLKNTIGNGAVGNNKIVVGGNGQNGYVVFKLKR